MYQRGGPSQTILGTLVYSPQCTRCLRLLHTVKRLGPKALEYLLVVDVSTLKPRQLLAIKAVPTIVTPDGRTFSGTAAFEWVSTTFQSIRVEPESFDGFGNITFSDVNDSMGFASKLPAYTEVPNDNLHHTVPRDTSGVYSPYV
jgi:hypothetical protein